MASIVANKKVKKPQDLQKPPIVKKANAPKQPTGVYKHRPQKNAKAKKTAPRRLNAGGGGGDAAANTKGRRFNAPQKTNCKCDKPKKAHKMPTKNFKPKRVNNRNRGGLDNYFNRANQSNMNAEPRQVRVYGSIPKKVKSALLKTQRKHLGRRRSALGSSMDYRSEADIDMAPKTQSPVLYIVEENKDLRKLQRNVKAGKKPIGGARSTAAPKMAKKPTPRPGVTKSLGTAIQRQLGGVSAAARRLASCQSAMAGGGVGVARNGNENETKPKRGTSKITFFYNMGQKHKKVVKPVKGGKSKKSAKPAGKAHAVGPVKMKKIFTKKTGNSGGSIAAKRALLSKQPLRVVGGTGAGGGGGMRSKHSFEVPLTMHIPIIDIEPTAKDLLRDSIRENARKPSRFTSSPLKIGQRH